MHHLNFKLPIAIFVLIFAAVSSVGAETIFETFDSDPTSDNWVDAGAGSTTFTYNGSGYLDCTVYRDSANTARYYSMLGDVYDKTQEFWFEADMQLISTTSDYQRSLFGVFDYNTSDNSHNFVGDRFAYKQYLGSTRYNRNDICGSATDGTTTCPAATVDDTNGIAFGDSVRVKGHYWYESTVGKATLSVYRINASDGSTGSLIMHSGTTTIIGSGKSLSFDQFGIGNRTDGSAAADNIFKVDNLYFSTDSANADPVKPSWTTVTADFTPIDDSFIKKSIPTGNYGTWGTMRIRAEYSANKQEVAYLKFNVSGVSGPVLSAKLKLRTTTAVADANLFSAACSWDEDTITWNNDPILWRTRLDRKTSLSANTWYEFDVSSAVKCDGTYTFALRDDSDSTEAQFSSKEGSYPPVLEVVYSPYVLKPSGIFDDNMMLQRNAETTIWGWAEPNDTITVTPSWDPNGESDVTDANGQWSLNISTPNSPGPYTITIEGQKTITLDNVLCGDIWLCSGQSNMAFDLNDVVDSATELAGATDPNIRHFMASGTEKEYAQTDISGAWTVCTPANADTYSAVAYFFAKKLRSETGVPIGLIEIPKGGYPIAPFMSIETLENDPCYSEQLARTSSIAAGLYNLWLKPLAQFDFTGAIWYQGESDAGRGWLYRKLFPDMIGDWRTLFGNGNFPFYWVQIGPWTDYSGTAKAAELREAQFLTLSTLSEPNTGMVVMYDTVTDITNIHPPDKKPVGERLALWALTDLYGKSGFEYSGPLYDFSQVESNKMRIYFTNTGSGLTKEGASLTNFTIAASNKVFYSATATLDANEPNSVVVSSPSVSTPAAVRFGWTNAAQPNLFNDANLPASTFRTDDWPAETYYTR